MKLAIQLTSRFGSEDVRTVRKLAEAALSQGHEVSLFLMEDGALHLPFFKGLLEHGVVVALCAHNAHLRGIFDSPGVLFGGQLDWAKTVNEADRVVSFG